MKQIEDYLDSICTGLGNKQEIREWKAEMRAHLLETVEELQADGYSEADSVRLAIERFGDQKQLGDELQKVLNVERLFKKNLLYVALVFLVIGLGTLLGWNYYQAKINAAHSQIDRQIFAVLQDEQTLTPELKQKLDNIVSPSRTHFNYIAVFHRPSANVKQFPLNLEQAVYVYPNAEARNPHAGEGGGGSGQWFLQEQWNNYGTPLDSTMDLIGCLFLFGYWILFAIWAIVNSYHQKRFRLLYVAAFVLLNVFGYLLYRLAPKKIVIRFAE